MYDPTDENMFVFSGIDFDKWKYFYPDAQQMMSRHMPDSLGKYVAIKVYMDANHARNM